MLLLLTPGFREHHLLFRLCLRRVASGTRTLSSAPYHPVLHEVSHPPESAMCGRLSHAFNNSHDLRLAALHLLSAYPACRVAEAGAFKHLISPCASNGFNRSKARRSALDGQDAQLLQLSTAKQTAAPADTPWHRIWQLLVQRRHSCSSSFAQVMRVGWHKR